MNTLPPAIPSRTIVVIRCGLCDRQRECLYLGPTQFGGRWQCLGCGCEFDLPPELTAAALKSTEGVHYG